MDKDFNPDDEANFRAWLAMRPSHLSAGEWQFALGRLSLLLKTPSVKTEQDRSMLILGWKSANGLLDPASDNEQARIASII